MFSQFSFPFPRHFFFSRAWLLRWTVDANYFISTPSTSLCHGSKLETKKPTVLIKTLLQNAGESMHPAGEATAGDLFLRMHAKSHIGESKL